MSSGGECRRSTRRLAAPRAATRFGDEWLKKRSAIKFGELVHVASMRPRQSIELHARVEAAHRSAELGGIREAQLVAEPHDEPLIAREDRPRRSAFGSSFDVIRRAARSGTRRSADWFRRRARDRARPAVAAPPDSGRDRSSCCRRARAAARARRRPAARRAPRAAAPTGSSRATARAGGPCRGIASRSRASCSP